MEKTREAKKRQRKELGSWGSIGEQKNMQLLPHPQRTLRLPTATDDFLSLSSSFLK